VQACAPAGAGNCQLSAFGAPVSALKQFLRKAPPREPLPAAWLGFRGVAAHDGSVAGVRVIAVDANGPAARAGLRGEDAARAGQGQDVDLIVAVEDAPVTTPEELRDAINRFALSTAPTTKPEVTPDAAARQVRLLVLGSGKFREVLLPLRSPRQLPEAPKPPAPSTGASVDGVSPKGDATKRETQPRAAALTAPSAPADKAETQAATK
jgi:hypothetical protein